MSTRGLPGGARSRCLWAFSIMTMAASTMAPMAMAMPPRLMMFEPSPSACMAAKAISTPTGSMMMATKALRTCSRKMTQTSATMTLSSTSVRFSVSMARMDEVRSVIDRHDLTPLGRLGAISASVALTFLMTVSALAPIALKRDAARHLALAIQLGDAAPLVRAELDSRHVLQQHRRAVVGA